MGKPGNGKDRTGGGPSKRSEAKKFEGTPADRLIRYWRSNDQRFDELLDEMLDARRQLVIEAAVDKLHEEEQPEFLDEVEAIAESVRRTDAHGDVTIATLFWLAVEVTGDLTRPPPVDVIERALDSSGLLETASDTRILPVWLDPEALMYLEAADRRTLLARMLESGDGALRFVQDEELVAVTDPDEWRLDEPRLVAVVGLIEEDEDAVADLGGESFQDPLRLGDPLDQEPDLDPVEEERIRKALDDFTAAVRNADPRIRRCEPAGGLNDLLDLLADAEWTEEGDFDELAAFIDVASDEVEDAVVDVEVSETPQGLFVRAYGSDGRHLDERTFALGRDRVEQAIAMLRQRCRRVLS